MSLVLGLRSLECPICICLVVIREDPSRRFTRMTTDQKKHLRQIGILILWFLICVHPRKSAAKFVPARQAKADPTLVGQPLT